jgi:two-component system LytT family response regulator
MTGIRTLIADDEPLARRRVRQLLQPLGDFTVIAEAADGLEAVTLVKALQPEVLFLDIHMPELNGFDVLAHAPGVPPPVVVFLTAHGQFAARAFDVNAADYLLKPIRPERFRDCVQRVRERLLLRLHASAPPDAVRATSVMVESRGVRRVIRPETIDWIEATDYYATVHAEGEAFLVRESLDSLTARLPGSLFVRAHRSALVNVARIQQVRDSAGGSELVLRDGTMVPVSRRRRASVLGRLGR